MFPLNIPSLICKNDEIDGYVLILLTGSSPATFVATSFAKFNLEGGDVLMDTSNSLQISFMLRTRSSSGQIISLVSFILFQ